MLAQISFMVRAIRFLFVVVVVVFFFFSLSPSRKIHMVRKRPCMQLKCEN